MREDLDSLPVTDWDFRSAPPHRYSWRGFYPLPLHGAWTFYHRSSVETQRLMGRFGRMKVNDFHKAADRTTGPGDKNDFSLAEGLFYMLRGQVRNPLLRCRIGALNLEVTDRNPRFWWSQNATSNFFNRSQSVTTSNLWNCILQYQKELNL